MVNNIKLLVIEIFVMLFVIVFSFMLCRDLSNNLANDVIADSNIGIKIVENSNIINDNVDETILSISNYNSKDVKCRLLMMIKKEDNLDYNVLKVKVDDEIFNLSTRYVYEDKNYLYFDLTHKEIDKQSNVRFSMWLDEKDFNGNLVYNFSVQRI